MDNWISSFYGISKGSFPAKFLGVPLTTKKLSKRDCQPLIERILSRINAWTTHFLSYAGRLQLIKSVLFAIQSYWSAHFILPKGIVNQLQSIFSRFLWNGNLVGKKAKVAWGNVTKPIEEGGVGIKDIVEWNYALIMKHLLKLVDLASNSIWAQWVRISILKNNSFWSAVKPSSCSWILKKIFNLRDRALPHINLSLGNGQNTFLWFDPWCGPPICRDFAAPLISHSGLPPNAKVSDILNHRGWNLPISNYHDLLVWKQNFNYNTHYNLQVRDAVLWDGINCNKIKVTQIWTSLREVGQIKSWAASVWHRIGVPRFSFYHWLIMHDRINTLDRLKKFGLNVETHCYFCINREETREHLFLECSFMQRILELFFHNRVASFPRTWADLVDLLVRFKPSDICGTIQILGFQICCYSIWLERNSRFHNPSACSPEALAGKCSQLLKCRLLSSNWFVKECNKNHSLEVWIRAV